MSDNAISDELDRLTCDVLGQALDSLAAGVAVPVLVALDEGEGPQVTAFSDDGQDECLAAAREHVRASGAPLRYALLYDGDVADDDGAYHQALIIEFAERGDERAWSGYVLYEGFGAGEGFAWSDPQPAGECPALL